MIDADTNQLIATPWNVQGKTMLCVVYTTTSARIPYYDATHIMTEINCLMIFMEQIEGALLVRKT